jgi:hypothetical protein
VPVPELGRLSRPRPEPGRRGLVFISLVIALVIVVGRSLEPDDPGRRPRRRGGTGRDSSVGGVGRNRDDVSVLQATAGGEADRPWRRRRT